MDKLKRIFLKKGFLSLSIGVFSLPFVSALQGINFNGNYQSNATKFAQVQQAVKTSAQSITTDLSWVDISGLSVSITPTSSTSKILIDVVINYSGQTNAYASGKVVFSTGGGYSDLSGGLGTEGSHNPVGFGLGVTNATNENYRMKNSSYRFLHSPATTSEITYKVQVWQQNDNIKINAPETYNDFNASHSCISTITVTEIL